jgi:hypothetical protein
MKQRFPSAFLLLANLGVGGAGFLRDGVSDD